MKSLRLGKGEMAGESSAEEEELEAGMERFGREGLVRKGLETDEENSSVALLKTEPVGAGERLPDGLRE